MRIEQFEAILSTAKHHSMQKSAKELFMTAQNVSKLIKEFEKELNIRIFIRNRYGVFPTKEGEYIISELSSVMDKLNALKNLYLRGPIPETLDDDKTIKGLKILAVPSEKDFVSDLFCYINSNFLLNGATINIQDPLTVLNQLESNNIDLFDEYDLILPVISNPSTTFLNKYKKRGSVYRLYKSSLGVHLNRAHSLASQTNVSIKDLLTIPLIAYIYEDNKTSFLLQALEDIDIHFEPKFIVKNEDSCHYLIHQGFGFSFLIYNDNWVRAKNDDTIVLPIKEKINFYHLLLVNPSLERMPWYSTVFNYINEYKRYINMQKL